MSSSHGGYDRTLLASAPAATKAQRQEGYDADLLAEPARTSPAPAESARPLGAASPQSHSLSHDKVMYGNPTFTPTGSSARVPFWRTTKGRIIMAIAAIAILAAIIGGAVGGTVGKKKNNNVVVNPSAASTGSNSGSQTDTGAVSTTSASRQGDAPISSPFSPLATVTAHNEAGDPLSTYTVSFVQTTVAGVAETLSTVLGASPARVTATTVTSNGPIIVSSSGGEQPSSPTPPTSP